MQLLPDPNSIDFFSSFQFNSFDGSIQMNGAAVGEASTPISPERSIFDDTPKWRKMFSPVFKIKLKSFLRIQNTYLFKFEKKKSHELLDRTIEWRRVLSAKILKEKLEKNKKAERAKGLALLG